MLLDLSWLGHRHTYGIPQRIHFRFGILAHLSLWLMVSYCDRWVSGVQHRRRRPSSTIASKDISSLTLAGFRQNLAGMILI